MARVKEAQHNQYVMKDVQYRYDDFRGSQYIYYKYGSSRWQRVKKGDHFSILCDTGNWLVLQKAKGE